MPFESANEYTTLLIDGVLENSSLVQDLSEDAAAYFVEWAAQQGERLGPMAADDESFDKIKRNFNRSLRMINAVCVRRAESAEALAPLFQRINGHGKTLHFNPIEEEARDKLRAVAEQDDLTYMKTLTHHLAPAAEPPVSETAIDVGNGSDPSNEPSVAPEDTTPGDEPPQTAPSPENPES